MKRLLLTFLLLVSASALRAASPAPLPTMPADLIERAVRLKSPRWKFVDKAVMRDRKSVV